MISEPDPKHIPHFALQPIATLPQRGHAGSPGVIFRHANLHLQTMIQRDRVELIYQLEARLLTKIIRRGEVGEEIESELRIISQGGKDRKSVFSLKNNDIVP